MKRILIAALLIGCRSEEPQIGRVYKRGAPKFPKTEAPDDDLIVRANVKESLADIGQDMYELGRKTERLDQQLAEMQKVALAIHCIERETGREIRGEELHRSMQRDKKAWQKCREEINALSREELDQQAKKVIEK